MEENIRNYVEFRFNELRTFNIFGSYLALLMFNFPMMVLFRNNWERFLIFGIYALYILGGSIALFKVDKYMMRNYLFKGLTSLYLNVLAFLMLYRVIELATGNGIVLGLLMVLAFIFYNLLNYISVRRKISRNHYSASNRNFRWDTGKAIALVVSIYLGRLILGMMLQSVNNVAVLAVTAVILIVIPIVAFYFINSGNMQLLKAYYINKYDLEKPEKAYIDLEDRLR